MKITLLNLLAILWNVQNPKINIMKKLFVCLLAMFLVGASAYAQRRVAVDTANYMRSSLYLLLLKDTSVYANAELIKQSFEEVPMPDKYNDHNLPVRVYTSLPSVTEEEIAKERTQQEFFPDGYLETVCIYRKLALEMLQHQVFIMHASVVEVDGEDILRTDEC